MLLNSNFHYFKHIFKSLEFALRNSYVLCCLIWTLIIWTFVNLNVFFSVLWPNNALANSNFRTFTAKNGKKNEDKYLIFILIVVKYLLVYSQILLLQKNEIRRESVSGNLNLHFCLLLQPVNSLHCLHVENTKWFWWNMQTFL